MNFLKNFIQFKTLDPVVRQLVIVAVVSSIGQIIFGTFINIYAYQISGWWNGLLRGMVGMLTTTFLAFLVVGVFSRKYNINMKPLLIWGVFIYGLSFLFMIPKDITSIIAWYIVYWIGNGLFYCAFNTYELKRVEIKHRGNYSGIWTAFSWLAKILVPLFVGLLFFLMKDISIDPYVVLLPIGSVSCFISLYRLRKIPNEYLPKLDLADIRHFFKRKNARWLFNVSLRGSYWIASLALLIISFYLLKTEANVGIYTSIIALFTLLALISIWRQVNENNRVRYLGFACLGLALMYIFYAYHITTLWLIVVSIGSVTLVPIQSIMDKVNYMRVLESLQSPTQNIFSPILSAEFLLYVIRMVCIGILLFLVWSNTKTVMKYALIISAIGVLLIWFSLRMRERKQRDGRT